MEIKFICFYCEDNFDDFEMHNAWEPFKSAICSGCYEFKLYKQSNILKRLIEVTSR